MKEIIKRYFEYRSMEFLPVESWKMACEDHNLGFLEGLT